jgi:hypothetical protein
MRVLAGACAVCLAGALLSWAPRAAYAHCDTMDGPVVLAAKAALERGDITGVLKWVRPADELEIRRAFERAIVVRAKGAEARELADQYFYETLVRVHRAGEGAAYEGLKPAGTPMEPAVAAADRALESGSVDEVVKHVSSAVEAGIRERFERAKLARQTAEKSVEAGREFVGAYVEFIHYVERLDQSARAAGHEGGHAEAAAAGDGH